jgi:hypothetical protein
MEFIVFLQGILAGIAIAFPKGPAGLLVINQTMLFGVTKGLSIARGPIMTTFVSCGIVFLLQLVGVDLDSVQQIKYNLVAHSIGGFFLIGVGLYIIFFLEEQRVTSRKLFIYTFLEPLLFPTTIGIFFLTSPGIFTKTIPVKILFYFGIVTGTFFWYYYSCKGYNWLSKKGLGKIIGIITIFLGGVCIIVGMCAVLIANHAAIFIF